MKRLGKKSTINIFTAKAGDKVMVTEKTAKNGDSNDKILVERYLKIGQAYEITRIEVGDFCTCINLKGCDFHNVGFNSVNFVDYEEPQVEWGEWELTGELRFVKKGNSCLELSDIILQQKRVRDSKCKRFRDERWFDVPVLYR